MIDYEVTDVQPPLDQLTPGVDEAWQLTATLYDDQGQPRTNPDDVDPDTGEARPVTVTGSWWTSGGWNFYPPQAYREDGNRHPQWEDPPGSGQMTDQPRTATRDEVEPFWRAYVLDPLVEQWEQRHPDA